MMMSVSVLQSSDQWSRFVEGRERPLVAALYAASPTAGRYAGAGLELPREEEHVGVSERRGNLLDRQAAFLQQHLGPLHAGGDAERLGRLPDDLPEQPAEVVGGVVR